MLHQIGIGTLGPVFRTYEPSRDRLVAVKAFRLDIVPEQAHALALALSRAAHASLFHPSIVEPIDAGVEGTLAYRAEEYVAAESLDVAMRHYAPATVEKVLPFITQLAGAIDFARAAGIGHGGLHPRDIFVTPDEARATGFGVVEALEQVGIRAPVRRPYSPPERIAGSAWGTPADVFSLAAITFELLTGKRPSGTGAQIGALAEAPNAASIHAVLARAMDDDPAKRYASALGFAAALEAGSQGRSTSDTVMLPPPIEQTAGRAAASDSTPSSPGPAHADSEATLPQSWHRPDAENEEPDVDPTIVGSAALPLVAAGEFEIEERLDPLHAALAPDREASRTDPTLFAGVHDGAGSEEAFASEFVEEQKAEPEFRSPLEDEPRYATPAAVPVAPPMFGVADPELHDTGDRSRSPILPYALTLVLGLLAGFAGGYFMGSRSLPTDEGATAQATPAGAPTAAAPTAAAPSGAATPDKPGQYSEQKVTPPAPAATAPSAAVTAPPPVARRAAPPTAPREPAPVQRGQIVVRSTPTRAGVTVNGKWRGRTPLTLENLPFGAYTVRVVQPGYLPGREEFSLNTRAPSHTFTARLERQAAAAAPAPSPSTPATFTGSIFVDSRPRGATVIVDGRSVGQTPLSVPDVKAGSHVVRIEMNGKKPVMANPRVVAGQTERITVSLEDRQDVSAAAREGTHEAAQPRAVGARQARLQRIQAGEGKR